MNWTQRMLDLCEWELGQTREYSERFDRLRILRDYLIQRRYRA